ncbi:DUF485 domain-containing protein [Rhodococcus sp. WS4]|nr:DUF485 domain-containing protein [Rhodococcus sp. WS4]
MPPSLVSTDEDTGPHEGVSVTLDDVLVLARRRRRISLLSAAGLLAGFLVFIVLTTSTTALSGRIGGLGVAYWATFAVFAVILVVAQMYARWARRMDAVIATHLAQVGEGEPA